MAAWATRAPALALQGRSADRDPFTLGVASGDPASASVVIWTRLAPDPLALDGLGGMPPRDERVRWEVAADPQFTRVVRTGSVVARPADAHAVHVLVSGLTPDREYHYRFTAMGHRSRVGRTRTTPAIGQASAARFGVVSCSRYETGYFTAYAHLADERPELVLHLGDYVYEYAGNPKTPVARPFDQGETITLADYRRRYAQYRLDPDLQRLHATAPFAVVWDDHEVDNNWAGEIPEDGQTREQFLTRRAAAFTAWHEVMPTRRAGPAVAGEARIYRGIQWGGLASVYMLDTRQYRDDQPCGDGNRVDCEERFSPTRTMLGATQERWLLAQASASRATWDVLGQQVFFGDLLRPLPDGRNAWPMDSWNGYVAARDRVLTMFGERARNLVVLTGDVHRHYAGALHAGGRPEGRAVGAEFVTTSVTSSGDGSDDQAPLDPILRLNPHLRYMCDRRGYLLAEVTPRTWTTHYRVVPWVTRPGAPLEARRSFVVEAGHPGLASAG